MAAVSGAHFVSVCTLVYVGVIVVGAENRLISNINDYIF